MKLKNKKEDSPSKLLATLQASLFGNLLSGKWATATTQSRGIFKAGKGKGIVRAGYGRPSSSASHKMDF